MNKLYLILSSLIAAEAVLSVQQNRAAVVVDLYNEKLNFFDSFLSPSAIDGLLLSAESITPETVRTLRSAWIPYTSLRGEIISWCTAINNTVKQLDQSSNLLKDSEWFASNVYANLNEMKSLFDSIATNGIQEKNVEDYKALITFVDGTRKFEVIYGHTPTNIAELLWPLLEKSKSEGNVTVEAALMTLNGQVKHAKSIITEALSVIYNTPNVAFNREDIVTKCRPILDKLTTSRTSPPDHTLPPQTITPSSNDILRVYPNGCGTLFSYKDKCEAVLSKSTMERLLKLYRIEQSVADFFNTINYHGSSSSFECKDRMISFIRDSYISWAYEVPRIGNAQSLRISICPNSDISVQVTIVG